MEDIKTKHTKSKNKNKIKVLFPDDDDECSIEVKPKTAADQMLESCKCKCKCKCKCDESLLYLKSEIKLLNEIISVLVDTLKCVETKPTSTKHIHHNYY